MQIKGWLTTRYEENKLTNSFVNQPAALQLLPVPEPDRDAREPIFHLFFVFCFKQKKREKERIKHLETRDRKKSCRCGFYFDRRRVLGYRKIPA